MTISSVKTMHEYTLVSMADPAIDTEHSDLERYQSDYLYDPKHLCFQEGERPTTFHCRSLTHGEVVRLLDRMMRGGQNGDVEVSVHEAALLAFRYGVTDIENFEGFNPRLHIQKGNPAMIRSSWLDQSGLPVDIIVEIGSVILARSRLSEGDRKN